MKMKTNNKMSKKERKKIERNGTISIGLICCIDSTRRKWKKKIKCESEKQRQIALIFQVFFFSFCSRARVINTNKT